MLRIQLDEQGSTSFFLCIVLGSLHGIRSGAVTPDLGIWGLGRPLFRVQLAEIAMLPEGLVNVLCCNR